MSLRGGADAEGLASTALTAELSRAFDNVISVVQGMDDTTRMREIRFFGQAVRIEGAINMAAGDGHDTGFYTFDYLRRLGEE